MITLFTRKENGRTRTLASSGFTLVELMVSLTIFSIVMLVSVGTLLIIIDVNAKAQALYTATTNLSFALDNMTREIRMGYNYYCRVSKQNNLPNKTRKQDCEESVDDYKMISFVRQRDRFHVGYALDTATGRIQQKVMNASGGLVTNWTDITSSDVTITRFKLVVENAEESYYEVSETDASVSVNGDTNQPYVDLIIEGYVNNGLETDTDFSIQSRIIQRRLDLI